MECCRCANRSARPKVQRHDPYFPYFHGLAHSSFELRPAITKSPSPQAPRCWTRARCMPSPCAEMPPDWPPGYLTDASSSITVSLDPRGILRQYNGPLAVARLTNRSWPATGNLAGGRLSSRRQMIFRAGSPTCDQPGTMPPKASAMLSTGWSLPGVTLFSTMSGPRTGAGPQTTPLSMAAAIAGKPLNAACRETARLSPDRSRRCGLEQRALSPPVSPGAAT